MPEKINSAFLRIKNEVRRQLNGQPDKEELRSLKSELLRVFGNVMPLRHEQEKKQ